MAREQDGLADFRNRSVEIGVVLPYAPAEIGMPGRLPLPHERAAVLAQVERVEGVAFRREALRHVALEEVVAEAVDVEHGAARRLARGQTHKRGHGLAVVIVGEAKLERLESRQ